MMNMNWSGYTGMPFAHQDMAVQPPSLDMDLYSPASGLNSSSPASMDFVVPSQTTLMDSFDMSSPMRPVKPFQFDSPTSDYGLESSFNESPASSIKYFMSPCSEGQKSSSATPSRHSNLRQPVFEPLESSLALQRVQEQTQVARHGRKQRVKRDYMLPNNITVQKQAKRPCLWQGCEKKFRRQEHLKRHMKTHEQTESYPCDFCNKSFGRTDNLKCHIKIHADPNKKSSRTIYYPEARRVYEEMSRKPRKGPTSQAKTMTVRSRI
jgi:zinc finger protein BrlA